MQMDSTGLSPPDMDISENTTKLSSPSSCDDITLGSKTGFLTKRAISTLDAFANWKTRFFVLSNGILSYYKQNTSFFAKEDIAHLKGEIILTKESKVEWSAIDEKVNCFAVITKTKVLYVQAKSYVEGKEWVDAISGHIEQLKKNIKKTQGRRKQGEEDDRYVKCGCYWVLGVQAAGRGSS